MQEFPGPHERIRRILDNALGSGCTYVSSHAEGDGTMLVLKARCSDGRDVGVRFRGLRDAQPESTRQPDAGTPLKVRTVKREGPSLLGQLLPLFVRPGPMYARVRIDAGPATLEIVCQDAEWWEE